MRGGRARDRERGAALVWALVLLLFAAALSALLLERGRGVDTAARTDLATLKARYAAEGGVAIARHRLATDPTYAGGAMRVGECDVVVRVERSDAGWRVTAAAQPGGSVVDVSVGAAPDLPRIESRRTR
ncbi:MAG TPA: hypothetical protein VFY93_04475 [Planctomycetota bacterium]|nr:hypothetical protein [Planctomycetota bacterium]